MAKDDAVYLSHMLDLATEAVEMVKGVSRQQYDVDRKLQLSLAHLIQNVGEAARRVSPPAQKSMTGIPWKLIIGMRHKVVHDYFDVDFDLVWETASISLPALIIELRKNLPPIP
jgi:uncharacterized protein with HEPN domain